MLRTYLRDTLCFAAGEVEEDDTPKPDFKPPPVVPKEDNRTGANKKTYFVCNEGEWLWVYSIRHLSTIS